jgi:hypothetical protein
VAGSWSARCMRSRTLVSHTWLPLRLTAMPYRVSEMLPPPYGVPQAPVYYRYPFTAISSQRGLVPYIVLDIEPVHGTQQGANGK